MKKYNDNICYFCCVSHFSYYEFPLLSNKIYHKPILTLFGGKYYIYIKKKKDGFLYNTYSYSIRQLQYLQGCTRPIF